MSWKGMEIRMVSWKGREVVCEIFLGGLHSPSR